MNEAVGIDTSKYVKGVDYGDLDMWNAEKAYLGSIPQEMKAILHNYILFEIQGWRAIIRI